MRYDLLIPLLLTTFIAMIGWVVVHRLNSARDLRNKRLELRTKYLLEVYRRLERSVGQRVSREVVDDLESAIADLQLLASRVQVEKAYGYAEHFGGKNLDKLALGSLLADLRDSIREDLGLENVEGEVTHLRIHITNEEKT
jgi:glucose-6-phosphate-specific signal transduction histidine kinase